MTMRGGAAMSIALIAILCTTMLATSFLSGIFGMAGGVILIGGLLAIMPLPEAMALHAVTQMASNGWRALLWLKYVMWRCGWGYFLRRPDHHHPLAPAQQ